MVAKPSQRPQGKIFTQAKRFSPYLLRPATFNQRKENSSLRRFNSRSRAKNRRGHSALNLAGGFHNKAEQNTPWDSNAKKRYGYPKNSCQKNTTF